MMVSNGICLIMLGEWLVGIWGWVTVIIDNGYNTGWSNLNIGVL